MLPIVRLCGLFDLRVPLWGEPTAPILHASPTQHPGMVALTTPAAGAQFATGHRTIGVDDPECYEIIGNRAGNVILEAQVRYWDAEARTLNGTSPRGDAAGRLRAAVGAYQDITARKQRTEAALRE